ncbi:hypothetical protein ACN28S_57495 [Cystobacter fuscus]
MGSTTAPEGAALAWNSREALAVSEAGVMPPGAVRPSSSISTQSVPTFL